MTFPSQRAAAEPLAAQRRRNLIEDLALERVFIRETRAAIDAAYRELRYRDAWNLTVDLRDALRRENEMVEELHGRRVSR